MMADTCLQADVALGNENYAGISANQSSGWRKEWHIPLALFMVNLHITRMQGFT